MFALCVESSHARGMGHLFRALNLRAEILARGGSATILVNDDPAARRVLKERGADFRVVDLGDEKSDWEGRLARELPAHCWVDDRLTTSERHARRVKDAGVFLATIDDRGEGARLSDVHFAPMSFEAPGKFRGPRVLRGLEYLILDPAIARFRRERARLDSLVVSLGGSDTYGVSVKVVAALREAGRKGTVIAGPSFRHLAELEKVAGADFEIARGVASLPEEFSKHDLAVTGGGMTAFEAAAAGLPTIVVANEPWEVAYGRKLEALGASSFAGFHESLDAGVFSRELDLAAMSRAGMAALGLAGARNVFKELAAHG